MHKLNETFTRYCGVDFLLKRKQVLRYYVIVNWDLLMMYSLKPIRINTITL